METFRKLATSLIAVAVLSLLVVALIAGCSGEQSHEQEPAIWHVEVFTPEGVRQYEATSYFAWAGGVTIYPDYGGEVAFSHCPVSITRLPAMKTGEAK
jgi:hypothetical protein